jgi:hypothetical protein
LIAKNDKLKVLGRGEVKGAINVTAHAFSATAKAAIEAKGGSADDHRQRTREGMKNLIDTVKNIWRIEELRSRILITLGLLLVYRIGSFIVLPGVDSAQPGGLRCNRRRRYRGDPFHLHRWGVHPCIHLRVGHHAVHLGLHRHAAGRDRSPGGAEDADVRRAGAARSTSGRAI